jgi:ketosteroid isomerase-like protein
LPCLSPASAKAALTGGICLLLFKANITQIPLLSYNNFLTLHFMSKLIGVPLLFICFFGFAQNKNITAIKKVLQNQTEAWNSGNIEAFMNGYIPTDSLMFIGKSGITFGYEKTLANYKKGYPDTAAMGKLQFTLLQIKPLSKKYYFVVGKWFLKRSIGDVGGHFTLLFNKIKKQWYIVADHSS